MDTSTIKIHDVILLSIKSKNRAESWYDREISGVVMAIGERNITIIVDDGEKKDFDLLDEKYDIKISEYSEVAYKKDIEKSISDSREKIKIFEKELLDRMDWKNKFNDEVSLLGKLKKFFKGEGK